MKVCIINTGDEVVNGNVVNTNATFMAKKLFENGYDISFHLSIKDNDGNFADFLENALLLSDIIIMTGGLGPTCDDLTRKTLASFFNCGFSYRKEVEEDLVKRYGKGHVWIEDQSTIPTSAKALLNSLGTAPGLLFEEKEKVLIALPGVPHEMRSLMEEKVIPYLLNKFGTQNTYCQKRLQFCLIIESTIDPVLREIKNKFPTIEIGIYPSYATVEVIIKSKDLKEVELAEKELLTHFGTYQYHSESGKISEALHHLLISGKQTLAFAESCTGGNLAKEMTTWPSSSSYFLGSFVTYSNELKQEILKVDRLILEGKGAVSQECVEEMVKGVFAITTAKLAVAVSGIAGPEGAAPGKPVGTVWVSIGRRYGDVYSFKLSLTGSREVIITKTTNLILSHLYRLIKSEILPPH